MTVTLMKIYIVEIAYDDWDPSKITGAYSSVENAKAAYPNRKWDDLYSDRDKVNDTIEFAVTITECDVDPPEPKYS